MLKKKYFFFLIASLLFVAACSSNNDKNVLQSRELTPEESIAIENQEPITTTTTRGEFQLELNKTEILTISALPRICDLADGPTFCLNATTESGSFYNETNCSLEGYQYGVQTEALVSIKGADDRRNGGCGPSVEIQTVFTETFISDQTTILIKSFESATETSLLNADVTWENDTYDQALILAENEVGGFIELAVDENGNNNIEHQQLETVLHIVSLVAA